MNYLFQHSQFSPYARTKYAESLATRTKKAQKSRYITGYFPTGITEKTAQHLVDTKDKNGEPTGVIRVNTRKTQRNDKCPCGSGKKFKHCHLS